MDELNIITGAIVHAAYQISAKLGPRLSEDVYETVLARDLARKHFEVERQKYFSFDYEGLWFENAFRVDLLVNRAVCVEIKSAKSIRPEFKQQLLTYIKLADLSVGLLINFGAAHLRGGIVRMVN